MNQGSVLNQFDTMTRFYNSAIIGIKMSEDILIPMIIDPGGIPLNEG